MRGKIAEHVVNVRSLGALRRVCARKTTCGKAINAYWPLILARMRIARRISIAFPKRTASRLERACNDVIAAIAPIVVQTIPTVAGMIGKSIVVPRQTSHRPRWLATSPVPRAKDVFLTRCPFVGPSKAVLVCRRERGPSSDCSTRGRMAGE